MCLLHVRPYVVCSWIFISGVGRHELRFPELAHLQSLAKLGGHSLDQVVPLEDDGNPPSHCIVSCGQRGSFLALKCLKRLQTSRPESRHILACGILKICSCKIMPERDKSQLCSILFSSRTWLSTLLTPSLNQVLVKDPAKLNVARFQRISSFLEVVVGLLLGFFLSSSMQRLGIQFCPISGFQQT